MGSQTKYKNRDVVYVPVKPIAGNETSSDTFKYVFLTNIPDADRATLGQVPVSDLMRRSQTIGLVVGSSYPKPSRAGQRGATRYTSSYVDAAKIPALKKVGWRISKAKSLPRYINNSASFVQTQYVTINGINYAWNMPKVTETNVTTAVLTALGHKVPTRTDIAELVFGAEMPRPPRAKTVIGTGEDAKNVSTFYDPSVTIPEKWTNAKNGRFTID
jgi:hypothetical protein